MIHVQSIFFMASLMCAVSSAMGFAQARRLRESGRSLQWAALGQALVALCFLIAVLNKETAPNRYVSFGVNLFWLASFPLLLIAVFKHYGRPLHLGWVLGLAVLAQAPNVAWSLVVDLPRPRMIFVSTTAAVYCMAIIGLILRYSRQPRSVGELTLLWGMTALSLTTMIRCLLVVLEPPPPADWSSLMRAVSTLYLVTVTGATMLTTFAFKSMCSDREHLALERDALVDSLTGLLTRRAFMHHVEREEQRSQRKGGTALSVLMFDLDHFKSVNDRFGHEMGDKVLVRASAAITTALRSTDVLSRFGGEEFMALLPEADEGQAHTGAQRARAAVEQLVFSAGEPERVTVSIGVCTYQPGDTFDQVYRRADRALYAAKRAGRNRVETAAAEPAEAPAPQPRHGKAAALP